MRYILTMQRENWRQSDFIRQGFRRRAKGLLAQGDGETLEAAWRRAGGKRLAAVLAPLIEDEDGGGHSVLLTRRAASMPSHGGQISFPGGKVSARDQSIEAAALRETHEETGIEARYVDILGRLDSHSTGTGFCIHPVVGLVRPGYRLAACAREVDEIFTVPLYFLMRAEHYRRETIVWRGERRRFYVIDYGDYRIWGATAFILRQLRERLVGA